MMSLRSIRLTIAGVLLLVGSILFFANSVSAQGKRVLTFGADLSETQRQQVAKLVGVAYPLPQDVKMVTVTNQQERKYLSGLVPDQVIGNKAISSALIELLQPGSGIIVFTQNISWVSKDMFVSALATAGVKDARVTAVAPFSVSGTAALTGILTGFEQATGQQINEQAKRIANQELVQMGELGQAINDKEKATQLITIVKERIISQQITDPAQIKQIVINVAGDLNINLTDKQVGDIVQLMQNIGKLDINIQDLRGQVENITKRWQDIMAQDPQVQGLLQQILAFLQELLNRLRAVVGG